MGEIVSLKLHRKRKNRAAKEEMAAENRVQFGRSKAEKALTELPEGWELGVTDEGEAKGTGEVLQGCRHESLLH